MKPVVTQTNSQHRPRNLTESVTSGSHQPVEGRMMPARRRHTTSTPNAIFSTTEPTIVEPQSPEQGAQMEPYPFFVSHCRRGNGFVILLRMLVSRRNHLTERLSGLSRRDGRSPTPTRPVASAEERPRCHPSWNPFQRPSGLLRHGFCRLQDRSRRCALRTTGSDLNRSRDRDPQTGQYPAAGGGDGNFLWRGFGMCRSWSASR